MSSAECMGSSVSGGSTSSSGEPPPAGGAGVEASSAGGAASAEAAEPESRSSRVVEAAAPAARAECSGADGETTGAAAASASSSAPIYEVNVKCIDGTTTKLEVPSDLRGAELKELILQRLDVPVDRQRLIFRGRVVKDEDLVGQHITESGQTLHMVQRPGPPPGLDQQQQTAGSEATAPATAMAQIQMGPQVHFQFTTTDTGAQGGLMPQVDLSQILSTVFGTVGRGTPINLGAFGPRGLVATAPMAGTAGAASAAAAPGAASSTGAVSGEGWPPQPSGVPPPLSASRLAAEIESRARGLREATEAIRSVTFPGGQGSAATATGGPAATSPAAGGAGEQAVLGPLQIVFQQGLGNLAHVIPAVLGATQPLGDAFAGDTVQARGTGMGNSSSSSYGMGLASGEGLPWRDLRRLHQHLARLLGRSNQHRALPPAGMPGGELNTFLSVLLGATSQLSVAISDLQASLADGEGPQPRCRLQFAMALVAAARTMRGLSTAMQTGFAESQPSAAAAAADLGTSAQAAAMHEALAQGSRAGALAAEEPSLPDPSSDSDEEPAADDGAVAEAQEGPAEDLLEFLEPATDIGMSTASPRGGDGGAASVASDVDGGSGGLNTGVSAGEASQMMQMLPQLFEQLMQPQGTAVGSRNLAGGGAAAEVALLGMPPEVAAQWRSWTHPANFGRIVEQGLQPPFSNAYLSGDAAGVHRAPVLPPPQEFLPLRWTRAAGRVEGLREVPEPPEHLARAYLSAFLRDLGQHIGRDATFASVPEANGRYPHLSQLMRHFGEA